MNYKKVNKALADEFGKGNIEVRKASPGAEWEYTLWFRADNPSKATIRKAQKIVNGFEPTHWFMDKMFHSES